MTNEDKITLTREQWDAFYREGNCTEQCYPSFDSLKANVEKPKRRRGTIEGWPAIEIFPDDIGPMTREEARERIKNAWAKAIPYGIGCTVLDGCCEDLLKALGLGEE